MLMVVGCRAVRAEDFTSDRFGTLHRIRAPERPAGDRTSPGPGPGLDEYLAYRPRPLPWDLTLEPATVRELSDAEAALGRLAGAGRLLPNPHLLVRPHLSREAVASTRIEGTQASLGDLFQMEAAGTPPGADLEEVVNYLHAMEVGIAALPRLHLSARFVREMHEVLLAGVRGRHHSPGELRAEQNWIGPRGARIQRATFVPPPPDEIGALLDDWVRFAATDGPLPVLVQCGLLHYQFQTIHPFLDGNGRLGRLLIVFFLIERGRLPSPILYLSSYFEARRREYYDRLQAVRERGEMDEWLRFFLRGVERQSTDAMRRAERLVDLRETYRQRVAGTARASRLVELVDLAFELPVLTARVVESRLAVSRPTALSLLARGADLDVLVEQPAGPRAQRRWVAEGIVDIVAAHEA
jgi:Fic family protein